MTAAAYLGRLEKEFLHAQEEYRQQVEATLRLLMAEESDHEAIEKQHQAERRAFQEYHSALCAFLRALTGARGKAA